MLGCHGREDDASRVGTPGWSFVVVVVARRRASSFARVALRNRDLV
jgi:hypothetical protein